MCSIKMFQRAVPMIGKQIYHKSTKVAKATASEPMFKTFKIYRYNPEHESKPILQEYTIDLSNCGSTVLHALIKIKSENDSTLTFRRSCREGICGQCAMNINGCNCLACITKINRNVKKKEVIYPLPHAYVIKDLVVNMDYFFKHYKHIEPWLQRARETKYGSHKQLLQSTEEWAPIGELYACVLCGCCSHACPSYWWNGTQERFLGPAALLHAYRWIIDSRDDMSKKRLRQLRDKLSVYRCHTIMNCIPACPKGLNPAETIAKIKGLLAGIVKKPRPELR